MATHEKRGKSYRITCSLGYDMSGRQIRKRMTWTPTAGMTKSQIVKELKRQKVLFEEKCNTGQMLDSNVRFSVFAELWFRDHAEKQLKAKTVSRYKDLMKRINPAIGHLRLDRIQPHHLMAFYSNLQENGIRDDVKYTPAVDFTKYLFENNLTKVALVKATDVSIRVINSITSGRNINATSAQKIVMTLGHNILELFDIVPGSDKLSPKTIQHYHRLISSIMNTAVHWQVIVANPCDRVKPPKVESSPPKFLDDNEARYLLKLLDGENVQYQTMIKLLLYTGFRRGELCGLEWPDIDFDNEVIHVRRESLYLPELGIYEETGKSLTSIRSIKTPATAMTMLKSYRAWQAEEQLKLGSAWESGERLFTAWNGKPIHPDTLSGWFRDFVKKNNLPNINIHSLRHTNASLMIASGSPITTVAKRLGHSNAAVTGKIYAHAIESADEATAEVLDDMLSTERKV